MRILTLVEILLLVVAGPGLAGLFKFGRGIGTLGICCAVPIVAISARNTIYDVWELWDKYPTTAVLSAMGVAALAYLANRKYAELTSLPGDGVPLAAVEQMSPPSQSVLQSALQKVATQARSLRKPAVKKVAVQAPSPRQPDAKKVAAEAPPLQRSVGPASEPRTVAKARFSEQTWRAETDPSGKIRVRFDRWPAA